MTPYYQHAGIAIYHGDCREILPQLELCGDIVTDPVWPNCEHIFPGIDAFRLLRDALERCAPGVERVIIHLGNNSDPRFLLAVPDYWPFLRVCYLAYAAVGYQGRILRDSEIAYVFGQPPPSKPGARVLPGRTIAADVVATKSNGDKGWGRRRSADNDVSHLAHPTARNLQHVRWLVKWFTVGLVVDPFCGTGTVLAAAAAMNQPAIGIEIEEKYCEIAAKRLSQEVLQFT